MNILFSPNQDRVFLYLVLVGISLGVLYDVFVVKRIFLNSKLILVIDDIFFSFLASIIVVLSIFVTNNGIIRWYEMLALALGFGLYKATVSRIIIFVIRSICKLCFAVVKKLVYYLSRPFSALLKLINERLRPARSLLYRKKQNKRMNKFLRSWK